MLLQASCRSSQQESTQSREAWRNRQQTSTSAAQKVSNSTVTKGSLQDQLQCEADKIRKWKLKTEIDLKQKGSQIEQLHRQLTSITNSLTDAQLQNESLKLKLKDETSTREVIIKRVTTTREMCFALKNHLVNLTEQMTQCKSEKESLHQKESDLSSEYQSLSEKFQRLSVQSEESKQALELKLSEQLQQFESQCALYQQSISAGSLELEQSRAKLEVKQSELDALQRELAMKREEIHEHMQDKGDMQSKLEVTEQNVEQLKLEILEMQTKVDDLEKALSAQRENFEHKCAELDSATSTMEKLSEERLQEKVCLEQENQTLMKSLSDMETTHKALESSLETLQKDFDEALEALKSLNIVHDGLKEEKDETMRKFSELQDQYVEKVDQLHSSSQQVSQLQAHVEQTTAQLLESQKSHLEVQSILKDLEEAHGKLKLDTCAVSSELVDARQTYDELKAACEVLSAEKQRANEALQKLEAACLEKETSLDTFKNDLQTAQNRLDEQEQLIVQGRMNVEQLEKQAVDYKAELENTQQKLTNAEKSITASQRLEKELSSKLDVMRSSFQGESKVANLLLSEEKSETARLRSEVDALQEKKSSLEEQLKESKKDVNARKKELKQMDKEMKKLTNIIERKEDSLTRLQTELGHLKQDSSDMETAIVALNNESVTFRNTIGELKKSVASLTDEKLKALKETDDLHQAMTIAREKACQEVSGLEKQLLDSQESSAKMLKEKEDELAAARKQYDDVVASQEALRLKSESSMQQLHDELQSIKLSASMVMQEKQSLAAALETKTQQHRAVADSLAVKERELSDLRAAVNGLKARATAVATPLSAVNPSAVGPHTVSASPDQQTDTARFVHVATPHPFCTPVPQDEDHPMPSVQPPTTPASRRVHLPVTPRTPVNVGVREELAAKTLTPKTPRSCLKSAANLVPSTCQPRRKVAFGQKEGLGKPPAVGDVHMHSDSEESGSAFEVQMPAHSVPLGKRTPKKSSAMVDTTRAVTPLRDRTNLGPQALKLGPKEFRLTTPPSTDSERLPRSKPLQAMLQKEQKHLQKSGAGENSENRLAGLPTRSPGKFFKTGSALNRKSRSELSKKSFNMDSVFGFDD